VRGPGPYHGRGPRELDRSGRSRQGHGGRGARRQQGRRPALGLDAVTLRARKRHAAARTIRAVSYLTPSSPRGQPARARGEGRKGSNQGTTHPTHFLPLLHSTTPPSNHGLVVRCLPDTRHLRCPMIPIRCWLSVRLRLTTDTQTPESTPVSGHPPYNTDTGGCRCTADNDRHPYTHACILTLLAFPAQGTAKLPLGDVVEEHGLPVLG